MKNSNQAKKVNNQEKVRASISLPYNQYQELQRVADKHRVSLAWVVRDAVEHYLTRGEKLGLDK